MPFYNPPGGGSGGFTMEEIEDNLSSVLVPGVGVEIAYDDSSNTFTFDRLEAVYQDVDGSTITFDLAKDVGEHHEVTLGGDRILAIVNEKAGEKFRIKLNQDATGGRRVTWFDGITWVNGYDPAQTPVPGSGDTFQFLCTDTGGYAPTYLGWILSTEHGVMAAATSVPDTGVTATVTTLQEGSSGVNEVQQFSLLGSPTGGVFTLTFSGQTTAAIAFNASSAAIKSALESLSNIDLVSVTGGSLPGTAVSIEFQGTLASTNVPLITAATSGLTGGSISASVTTTTEGVPGATVSKVFAIIGATNPGVATTGSAQIFGTAPYPTSGTFTITWNGYTTSAINFDASFFDIAKAINAALPPDLSVFVSFRDANGPPGNGTLHQNGPNSNSAPTASIDNTNLVGGVFVISAYASPDGTYHAESAITGTYKLNLSNGVGGGDTVTINATATANDVQLAIQAVLDATIGGTVTVSRLDANSTLTGIAGGYFVEFSSDLGNMSLNDTDNAFDSGAAAYCPAQTFVGGGTNEVQRITTSGAPASGTFTLTYSGQTTADIAYNSSAATVDSALEALSNIGSGDVTCTGGPLPAAIDIAFTGSLAATNVPQITVNDDGLQYAASTTTPGSVGTNETQQVEFAPDASGGTFTITFDGQTTTAVSYSANNSLVKSALEGLSNLDLVAVTGGPVATSPISVEFQGSTSSANVPQMTVDDSLLVSDAAIIDWSVCEGSAITLTGSGSHAISHVNPIPLKSLFVAVTNSGASGTLVFAGVGVDWGQSGAPAMPASGDTLYLEFECYSESDIKGRLWFPKQARVLFDHYQDSASTSVDGSYDDLYSDSIAAGTLYSNGDKLIEYEYLSTVGSATAARRIRKYFGGALIFDSGSLTMSLGGDFRISTEVIRESSSVARCLVSVVTTSASTVPYVTYTSVSSLSFSSAQILKTSVSASGTGAAPGDITNKMASIEFKPAA